MYGHGIIRIINHKARRGTIRFFYIFSLQIINLKLFNIASFRIVAGKSCRFLKSAVRQFFSLGLYNDVGAGNTFGMELPVTAVCDLEGQLFVLQIVFSDKNIKAIITAVVEGLAFRRFCAFF